MAAGGLAFVVALMFTTSALWALLAATITLAVSMLLQLRRYIRRRRQVREPFPEQWQLALEDDVPFYLSLDEAGRERFRRDVRFFVAEQHIYGRKGKVVDDEIKVLVAASAAMLTYGLPDWEWPQLRDIVVYPTAFNESYEVGHSESILGMVHSQGPIIFSEQHLKHGFANSEDAVNVGLHEMAHVMDFASGSPDGIPAGLKWISTAPWVKLVADRLLRVRRGQSRALRPYAGTNEAEFFAVAVEVFFERPERLHEHDPELYRMLVEYFQQDPLAG